MTDPPEESRGVRPAEVRVYGWQWGPDERRRPGLPWVGIFLVVFGALLLLERVVPQFRLAGSAFLLAVGIVFLLRWAIERGTASLYAGSIITALAAPGVLEGMRIAEGPGLGTLCLGIAFLFIAAVRYVGRGGVGWQAWFGVILVAFGATRVALPDAIGALLLPAILVALGVVLIVGGFLPGRRWR